MGTRSVVAAAWGYTRLREDVAGAQLLRADLMPVMAAVLGEYLAGQQRVMLTSDFLEQAAEDLQSLRDLGFSLPRSIHEYLTEWVRTGIVIRRAGTGREETIELSASAMTAIRFLQELLEPRSSVTSSRLANVSDLLGQLARETNPDAASRLLALQEQRAALDAEIARVAAGDFQPLPSASARELLQEILRLAGQIPGDFATVSARITDLNRSLRERIINRDGTRGDVLDAVFAGVDLLEESEAGRSFNAFHALVLDPERSNTFDDAVEAVLSREFVAELPAEQVQFLRRLLSTLQQESVAVRDVMTGFSRSLRRFVESHAYLEQRRLADALAETQALCLRVATVTRPWLDVGYDLPATSMPLASIGSWQLHNPSEVRSADPVDVRGNEPLDLELLRAQVRESEIDFTELQANVADSLGRHAIVSIAEVLADHPATQGLASIVGLLVLAAAHATPAVGDDELTWVSARGTRKTVRARRYVFDNVPSHWSQR